MLLRTLPIVDFFAHTDSAALLTEYASEAQIKGLPTPTPDQATYALLEASGRAQLIAAEDNGKLIGMLLLVASMNPHYGVTLGVVESYFVASAARKTGAGLAMLTLAERLAKEAGAAGLLLSAPVDSRLDKVLAGLDDFKPTNRVYFKPLTWTH